MLLSIILGRSCLERQGYLRRHLVQSQMMALLWRQRLSAELKSLLPLSLLTSAITPGIFTNFHTDNPRPHPVEKFYEFIISFRVAMHHTHKNYLRLLRLHQPL